EAALCLALQGQELEVEGGILTPAPTMGMRLVERLRAAGLKFKVDA
ncbi:MAG: saccharopine dehydrogenase, partial [Myxococcales bacterium]|nr:saccharopine dehydrogenase [Myxococcales bacterium]